MEINFMPSYSLKDERVMRILSAALNSVDPKRVVQDHLAKHPMPQAQSIYALAVGKAAPDMMKGFASRIRLKDLLVITKVVNWRRIEEPRTMEAAHPVPDQSSLEAGEAALRFAGQLTPDDLLVCLISGGGSALMTSPRIPLNELQELTWELLGSGARIDEINTLRRHLDRVKGGGLARAANGARVLSLILSDVVGDRLEAIASGPTAPDPTTLEDVSTVLHKYGLRDRISRAAQQAMQETLKPGDPVFDRVENRIIANNETALRAAEALARQEGFDVQVLNTALQGEASQVGIEMAARLRRETAQREGPFCLLAGGETTVTVRGYGKGGRNQELALAAMPELAGLEEVLLVSLATDGQDGPTMAAGAVIDGESWGRANALGIDVDDALKANNSAPVFQALSDQIVTGPTGTNVNDLLLMFKL